MCQAPDRISDSRDAIAPSAGLRMSEESEPAAETAEVPRAARPRSPLIIGAIAYALLLWMVIVVCLLIAWRLSAQ